MDDSTEQMSANEYPPGLPSPDSSQQVDQAGAKPTLVKKSRRTLWIIAASLVLLLLLILGSVGFLVILPAMQEAALEQTLQTYCDAYKKADFDEFYSTLSTRFKAHASQNDGDFTSVYLAVKSFGASLTSCTVSNIRRNGPSATATVTLVLESQGTSTTSTEMVGLVMENGDWKVDTISSQYSRGGLLFLRLRYLSVP